MATVNKNFRIKNGLIVEGTSGTINNQNILTETGSDQYILDLVGGAALVTSVASGLSVTSGELSIDRTIVDGWYDAAGAAATAQSNAEDYADGLASNYDAAGAAATAQSNAEDYADGLASNYDAAGAASTAETNAKNYADDLIGDATVDGTSGNTVTARIASAVSGLVGTAPAVLDTLGELATALEENPDIISDLRDIASGKQGTLTASTGITIDGSNNISVTANTYDAYGAASTAQSNAEDYADGLASNYDAAGTASGLVDNLKDATTPFTAINLNSQAKQIAAEASSLGSVPVTVYQWAKSDYRSGKFLVKIDNGTHNEISEILLTLDSSDNVAITEYAIVGTNGSRGTITADVSGANVRVVVTPVNDSVIKISGTLLI